MIGLLPLVTGAEVAFWLLAPVMILAALGLIFAKKAVHCALCLAAVMISLAVQYAALQAPFLFVVQIIVYTGAILMLFLFVLMLVGVDSADSLIETIKGQRVLAVVAGVAFGLLLVLAVGNAIVGQPKGLADANSEYGGNVQGIAALIFTKEDLLAPLLPGMEQPPHPMRLGENEQDYYVNGPELARGEGIK